MFEPHRRKSETDDSHLPKGGCRFILLHPESKHLRCACVKFATNRSLPGSSCHCGHQAVYHNSDPECSGKEVEALKSRISTLEEELDRERSVGRGGLFDRLIQLEELVEKGNSEREVEIRSIHRGIGGLWQNLEVLNKRTPYYDDRIEGLVDDVHRIRARMIEVDDASMRVEDRVDALENISTQISGTRKWPRRKRASTPPASNMEITIGGPSNDWQSSIVGDITIPVNVSASGQEFPEGNFPGDRCVAHSWTVHVSLMPTSSQPFPFEKDTVAYKRCLSRGLHQKIVVPDTNSDSFKEAVNYAFAQVLRGRPWQPLAAKICEGQNLKGLPMLRKLDRQLVFRDYDVEFLKEHCAVLDGCGRIEDIYIAMLEETINWIELQELEPFIAGLESAWSHDTYLDGPRSYTPLQELDDELNEVMVSEKRPSADMLPSLPAIERPPSSTKLKRHASRISRTPSFGSTEGENSRTKLRQIYNGAGADLGRCAEIF
ncbi:50a5fb9b-5efc-430a-b6e3-adeea9f024ea-CDS [Sclerotinia trifoliorum]|uniref:50a5fb9b-5efc-430a-b6e3-adeea9f024ea-CDS n=1 Tax=Sclerotinia trifoliorum TaxID=28548 RepID=A0A8H2ZVM2_9HELO|nr:50a5fb9b-5efc-430a-b6e3-adeea9f024ea-CDS [Sclerotinia trifoliorum]